MDGAYKSFTDYLLEKDITVVENFNSPIEADMNNITFHDLERQLALISELHKKVMGYKGYLGKRLENKTGATIEQYKVNIKRLKRYLKNIRMNAASSDFERSLLKVGNVHLNRAEGCISLIYDSGYMDIIERSMKRTEICFGNIDFTNINSSESNTEIIDISKSCYNTVEMDCFNLLSKYKRKGLKVDYTKLVKSFCQFEGLGENSLKLILALLSYPYDFMKCCNRYRERTKDWSEEEYGESLKRAISKEGETLISITRGTGDA